ncbi:MAG: TonB-dependent receptor plug domain-containing protein [Oligoflexales bacterium]
MNAVLACFLMLVSNTLFAERIQLTVKEKGTGNPLSRAEVLVNGTPYYTSPNGIVDVDLSDDAIIQISKFQFESINPDVNELRTDSEIYLYPKAGDDEIVIVGKRRPAASEKTIRIEEAIKVAPNGDPVQVTKLLPGVQQGGFDNRVIIRGSGPEDSLYLIDKTDVPFIFHRVAALSILPPQLIDDVTFNSGGFGAQYGRSTGGVVGINTLREIPDYPQTEFTLNMPIYAGFWHEKPIDESSSISIGARHSLLQYIVPSVLKSDPDNNGMTIVPYFNDANTQYFKKLDDGHIHLGYYYSADGITAAFPSSIDDDEDGKVSLDLLSSFHNLAFERKKRLNREWSYTYNPNVTYFDQKTNFLGNRVNIAGINAAIPIEITQRISPKEKAWFGIEPRWSWVDLDLFVPLVVRDDPFFDFEEAPKAELKTKAYSRSTGMWAARDFAWTQWTITPSLRISEANTMKDFAVDPRLLVRYQQTPEHEWKLALGKYSQQPQPDETDSIFGNPNLTWEKAIHSIFGLHSKWGEYWITDFQIFHKNFKDWVRSGGSSNFQNSGSGQSYGFETFIRRNLTTRLFGWFSYTYSKNIQKSNPTAQSFPAEFDQTHVAALTGSYKMSAHWELSGRLTYNTGNPYTPIRESVYNANLNKYQPRPRLGDTNSERLPSIGKFSLAATHDLLWDDWKMQFRIGVEELTIGQSAEGVSYNYDYSKKTFVENIPAIPFIEVKTII